MAGDKTNALRLLQAQKIPYTTHSYDTDGAIDGLSVADKIQRPAAQVFKTLVARGQSGQIYVFILPVAEQLDLKKAAKAVGEKYIEMILQKELLGLTGYVHGGCSPIGMKKRYATFVEQRAEPLETMIVSAGKIGLQLEIVPADLRLATDCVFCSLAAE